MNNIGQTTAHEAFDRGNGVAGILLLVGSRFIAYLAFSVLQIAHDGWQQHPALLVGQAFGNAVAHSGYQRVRRTQVDAHGNAPLVRVRRLAGFGNLQQRHGFLSCMGEGCLRHGPG